MRGTRATVIITRGRQVSLDWCPDPRKQECAADRLGVSDYTFTKVLNLTKCKPRLKKKVK